MLVFLCGCGSYLLPLGLEGCKKAIVRLGKRIDAIVLQFRRDGIQVNAQVPELGNIRFRLRNILGNGFLRAAMVPECSKRFGRHSIDRLRANQLLDIQYVGIGGILGAGASPERPLYMRALAEQGGELVSVENFAKT